MEEIRRLGKLCDITLMANEQKFTAHRIVLAASIPYFHAMFLNEMIESRQEVITINTVDANALEQFINYSYNGMITITNDNVQSLFIGANFFHMKNIKSACCEFMRKRLCVKNALCLKSFAEQLMCNELLAAANRFINKHFIRIASTNEFLAMTAPELEELLERDDLNVDSEEQVISFIFDWLSLS
jgi:kelch-like protein 18